MDSSGDTATGGRPRRRVLFFPFPYQGHINSMLHLAGVLHARGFAVTVFHTHFNAPDASRHPAACDFAPVADGLAAAGGPDAAPFRERLAALLQRTRGEEDVACLVADAQLLTIMEVARGLDVPTLALRTSSAACFRVFVAYPMLCDKGYQPAQARGDTPGGDWGDHIHGAHPRHLRRARCRQARGAAAPASVLYISFDTLVDMSARDLVEMALGIANADHPFFWVLRLGLVSGGSSSQPPLLPDA
ncbi:hypothetical protein ACP4OV_006948 [Aristida adscensionis]